MKSIAITYNRILQNKWFWVLFTGCFTLFFANASFAAGTVTASQTAQNMLRNLGTIGGVIEAISLIIGVGLILGAFFRFKLYGQMRGNFMSYQMTLSGPLVVFISGVLLLLLPTVLKSSLLAFWGSSNPLAYTGEHSGPWSSFTPVIIVFIRVVGVVAFIRGVMLLPRAAGGTQAQPGTLSKALLHMLGGIMCINVVATHQLLASLLPI